MSTASILWSVLFGAIGIGYFIYGKRQRVIVPLISGLALMFFPYFISNTWALVLVGAMLTAVPYFIRL
jgi:hypothetical protein